MLCVIFIKILSQTNENKINILVYRTSNICWYAKMKGTLYNTACSKMSRYTPINTYSCTFVYWVYFNKHTYLYICSGNKTDYIQNTNV